MKRSSLACPILCPVLSCPFSLKNQKPPKKSILKYDYKYPQHSIVISPRNRRTLTVSHVIFCHLFGYTNTDLPHCYHWITNVSRFLAEAFSILRKRVPLRIQDPPPQTALLPTISTITITTSDPSPRVRQSLSSKSCEFKAVGANQESRACARFKQLNWIN